MLRGFLAVAAVVATFRAPAAQEVTGEWLVKDKVAAITVDNCAGQMWGVVSWEKDPGGLDSNNPDPAKRRRPTLGMPVLLAMKPTLRNRWEGEIYNAQDGKTYSARITLANPNVLRVEGCLLGFLCGGEDWTRVSAENPIRGRRPSPGGKQRPFDVCSRIADVPGGTEKRGLK